MKYNNTEISQLFRSFLLCSSHSYPPRLLDTQKSSLQLLFYIFFNYFNMNYIIHCNISKLTGQILI